MWYGRGCVSNCVGEPYAAKWQPRGGERLIKMEWEVEERGMSVTESFHTRLTVAKLSERCASRSVDETWRSPPSISPALCPSQPFPAECYWLRRFDVGYFHFLLRERGDKATESRFHFNHEQGWSQKYMTAWHSLSLPKPHSNTHIDVHTEVHVPQTVLKAQQSSL